MRRKILFSYFFSLLCLAANAQTYSDYFGNGNDVGVTTNSSSTDTTKAAENVLNGTGYFPNEADASRFLYQAAFGGNYDDIDNLVNTGIENWIDEQISLQPTSFKTHYDSVYQFISTTLDSVGLPHLDRYLSFTFYDMLMNEPDQLRQKTAFALSQIMVVSYAEAGLSDRAHMNAGYYDILYRNAFGNFKDILTEVTYHPSMGVYLSYHRNQKTDYANNIYPDENFAREIMQLFSIGLIELNNDGTPKLDSLGNEIPTYGNEEIEQHAKVFTGLYLDTKLDGSSAGFGTNFGNLDVTKPMSIFEFFHDKSRKEIIGGNVFPHSQTAEDEISRLIDILFNHPNVGPFISKLLIKQFVKSNPTPQYVNRVATVFNNNGNGVRGDMGAVVKTILMDPEARSCQGATLESSGRMLQPIERAVSLWKALNISTPSGKMYVNDLAEIPLEQQFLYSPTVFNYYLPSYAESSFVAPAGLVSPEFEIFNSVTTISYLNMVEDQLKDGAFDNQTKANNNGNGLTTNADDKPVYDLTYIEDIYTNGGVAPMLDHLDILLCRGQLDAKARTLVRNAITTYAANEANYTATDAVKDAIYFIASTPNFVILK